MSDAFVDGERPICVARQHIAIFIPYALVWVAAVAVGLGVLEVVDATLLLVVWVVGKLIHHWVLRERAGHSWRHFIRYVVLWIAVLGIGLLMLRLLHIPAVLVMILVAGVLLALRYMEWHFRTYTLTNQRVISSYGVVTRVSESLGLDKVQHTMLSRSVLARLFGYGDIVILSAGRGQERLQYLADADSFSIALTTAIQGDKATGGIVERFVPPTYDPGSGYSPPLGYGAAEPVHAGGGGA